VALPATVHHFDVGLSDVDRAVYERLSLKVARHPSETVENLAARVLAYCLEYAPGLGFSRGLAEADEPALAVRDLTGALQAWIDVGAPDAARLHKAAKAAPRVAVYTYRNPAALVKALSGERIHRADALELYALDRELVGAIAARLEKRTAFDLSVTERHLFVTIGDATVSGEARRLHLE